MEKYNSDWQISFCHGIGYPQKAWITYQNKAEVFTKISRILLMLWLKYCDKHIPFSYFFVLSENSKGNEKYFERILIASDKLPFIYSEIQKILSF